jgi:hypothetical protein
MEGAQAYSADNERLAIQSLRATVAQEEIPAHDAQFSIDIADDVLLIGSLTMADVQVEERRMEEVRVAGLKDEIEKQLQRERDIVKRENEARSRILALQDDVGADLRRRQHLVEERHQKLIREQQTAFREAEAQLSAALAERQAHLTHKFGDLGAAAKLKTSFFKNEYKVEWTKAPRLIRLKIDVLRAIKNKIPRGRYTEPAELLESSFRV